MWLCESTHPGNHGDPKLQLRHKDWGFHYLANSVGQQRHEGTRVRLGSVHLCTLQWSRGVGTACSKGFLTHTIYHKALPLGSLSLSSFSLSLPLPTHSRKLKCISESYLHTGIPPLKTGRGRTILAIKQFSHTDILSFLSCKVSLREAITSSLSNLLVLTLSSQQWHMHWAGDKSHNQSTSALGTMREEQRIPTRFPMPCCSVWWELSDIFWWAGLDGGKVLKAYQSH